MLNSAPVARVAEAIIGTMRANAYAESSITLSRRSLAHLVMLCESRGGRYTKLLGEEFAHDIANPKTGLPSGQRRKLRGRLTRLADSYLETGQVDLSRWAKPAPRPAAAAL